MADTQQMEMNHYPGRVASLLKKLEEEMNALRQGYDIYPEFESTDDETDLDAQDQLKCTEMSGSCDPLESMVQLGVVDQILCRSERRCLLRGCLASWQQQVVQRKAEEQGLHLLGGLTWCIQDARIDRNALDRLLEPVMNCHKLETGIIAPHLLDLWKTLKKHSDALDELPEHHPETCSSQVGTEDNVLEDIEERFDRLQSQARSLDSIENALTAMLVYMDSDRSEHQRATVDRLVSASDQKLLSRFWAGFLTSQSKFAEKEALNPKHETINLDTQFNMHIKVPGPLETGATKNVVASPRDWRSEGDSQNDVMELAIQGILNWIRRCNLVLVDSPGMKDKMDTTLDHLVRDSNSEALICLWEEAKSIAHSGETSRDAEVPPAISPSTCADGVSPMNVNGALLGHLSLEYSDSSTDITPVARSFAKRASSEDLMVGVDSSNEYFESASRSRNFLSSTSPSAPEENFDRGARLEEENKVLQALVKELNAELNQYDRKMKNLTKALNSDASTALHRIQSDVQATQKALADAIDQETCVLEEIVLNTSGMTNLWKQIMTLTRVIAPSDQREVTSPFSAWPAQEDLTTESALQLAAEVFGCDDKHSTDIVEGTKYSDAQVSSTTAGTAVERALGTQRESTGSRRDIVASLQVTTSQERSAPMRASELDPLISPAVRSSLQTLQLEADEVLGLVTQCREFCANMRLIREQVDLSRHDLDAVDSFEREAVQKGVKLKAKTRRLLQCFNDDTSACLKYIHAKWIKLNKSIILGLPASTAPRGRTRAFKNTLEQLIANSTEFIGTKFGQPDIETWEREESVNNAQLSPSKLDKKFAVGTEKQRTAKLYFPSESLETSSSGVRKGKNTHRKPEVASNGRKTLEDTKSMTQRRRNIDSSHVSGKGLPSYSGQYRKGYQTASRDGNQPAWIRQSAKPGSS